MKSFAAKVEEGREGTNGNLSVGPVYRNLLSKDQFPPSDPDLTTAWDIFRYKYIFMQSLKHYRF
jgi:long-chain acyl-CoA synthetase